MGTAAAFTDTTVPVATTAAIATTSPVVAAPLSYSYALPMSLSYSMPTLSSYLAVPSSAYVASPYYSSMLLLDKEHSEDKKDVKEEHKQHTEIKHDEKQLNNENDMTTQGLDLLYVFILHILTTSLVYV